MACSLMRSKQAAPAMTEHRASSGALQRMQKMGGTTCKLCTHAGTQMQGYASMQVHRRCSERRTCKVPLSTRRSPALPGLALALFSRIGVIQVGHKRLRLHLGRSRGLLCFTASLFLPFCKDTRSFFMQADMLARQTWHAFLHPASQ